MKFREYLSEAKKQKLKDTKVGDKCWWYNFIGVIPAGGLKKSEGIVEEIKGKKLIIRITKLDGKKTSKNQTTIEKPFWSVEFTD